MQFILGDVRDPCAFVLAVALQLGAGCGEQPCAQFRLQETFEPGTMTFAFRAEVEADAIDGGYGGRVTNRSTTDDCTIALYRFYEEPPAGVLPVLAAGDAAPVTLPGGGVLVEQRYLQAERERPYTLLLGNLPELTFGTNPERPHTEWLVGVTCPDPQLEMDMSIYTFACNEDDVVPSTAYPWVARVW